MHVGSTKRKAAVRCAAANDDEDFGDAFDSKEDEKPRKHRLPASPGGEANAAGSSSQGAKKRKTKEFAWMDSSDDEDVDQKDEPDSADEKSKQEDEQKAVSEEALDQVHSFGRMMLFAPAIQSKLRKGSLSPSEVAALCRALARTKFFDRELLDDLYEVLRTMLAGSKISVLQTSDVIKCLKALNAYNREVCSAISRCFTSKILDLEVATRNEWLEAFRAFDHKTDPGFMQILEVPPVPPHHPNYKKVRCWHFSRGSCALSSTCAFSHDPGAPLSLSDGTKEDWWKCKSSIMMTQNQKTMGCGEYGTGRLGMKNL